MKQITVLGSTGSIGVSTLDVIQRHPDAYKVLALTANRSVEKLRQQCLQYRPRFAVMSDPTAAVQLAAELKGEAPEIEVLADLDGLEHVAALPEADYVMAAIVGAAGLRPALSAVRAGKRLLLANKEALVVSGHLFMEEVARSGAEILPIDSEHNAIFQCMPRDFKRGLEPIGVRRILLTASGGPFRDRPKEQLKRVTPDEACDHPNWSMGRKISVDSATMMNKGLELIEACWLFHTTADKIQVVLHPQSIIHSMVEYVDGSVLAQMGNPDMRTPIAHALAWPQRIESGVDALNLFEIGRLDFQPPDMQRFPCLRLAYEAITAGGTAPAVLNAANEIAVDAFLNGSLKFTAIPQLVEATLSAIPLQPAESLEQLMTCDTEARKVAEQKLSALV
ncbi:MAG: 1-deoxy-D-xylulose-5-phosphate reductoisomerase [Candidatus Polarisedimenticolaceae bacterium]|nr:1-deoxy-D-xylulose-5-phosphate reductoisomerase [Candidatus Polarisedimenticolaceae bacterium]